MSTFSFNHLLGSLQTQEERADLETLSTNFDRLPIVKRRDFLNYLRAQVLARRLATPELVTVWQQMGVTAA